MFSKFKTVIITILLKRVASDNPKKIEPERVKRPWGNICVMFEVESHCGKNLFADDLNRTKIINERNRVLSHLSQLIIKIDTLLFFRNQQSEEDALTFSASANGTFQYMGQGVFRNFRHEDHLGYWSTCPSYLRVKKGAFSMFTLSLFLSSGIFNVSPTY